MRAPFLVLDHLMTLIAASGPTLSRHAESHLPLPGSSLPSPKQVQLKGGYSTQPEAHDPETLFSKRLSIAAAAVSATVATVGRRVFS